MAKLRIFTPTYKNFRNSSLLVEELTNLNLTYKAKTSIIGHYTRIYGMFTTFIAVERTFYVICR